MTSDRSLFKNQDYKKLKEDCLKSGELFFDELFKRDVSNAMWLRPNKIVKDPKFFVGGASRFDVIQGSNSGCWLLVAMANLTMNPTLFHHVVPKDQCFTEGYAGIFRFNIWQFGKWVEVVVDDRLPTKEGSSGSRELMFVHSKQNNEFWSALLEKAYAKLFGSYNELTSGWFNEAMVDFTGGIVERVELYEPPEDLGTIISKSLQKSSFICVFMLDDPSIKEMVLDNGLVKGHAYSINKVQTVSSGGQSVILLRLRNPWGKIEWKGAWSDSSPEWKSIPDEEKNKTGLTTENDGEFWMTLKDFSENFESMDICHLTPNLFKNVDGKEKIGWESQFFIGDWTKGISAGGFLGGKLNLNPQYRIVLTDADDDEDELCTVIVGLIQKNKTRQVWHRTGFALFHLEEPEKLSKKPLSKEYIEENFENSFSSDFRKHRENVVRDRFEPGVYCIIPCTYKPDEEGQFLLRVYSEKKASIEENETSMESSESVSTEQNEPIPTGKDAQIPQVKKLLLKNDQEVSAFFQKIAGNGNETGWQGLQSVLEYALTNSQSSEETSTDFFSKIKKCIYSLFSGSLEKKSFTKDECRNMIAMLDDDRSGRMSFEEFQILWKSLKNWEPVFLNYSKKSNEMDATELSKALKDVGYNVKTSDVSRLVRKYADSNGKLTFGDFVMCSIELLKTGTS